MKILFVSDSMFCPSLGGIERVTDIIVRELSKREKYEFAYLAEKETNSLYDYPAQCYYLPWDGGFENPDNVVFYKNLLIENHIDLVVNQRGWKPFMDSVIGVCDIPTISVVHSVLMAALKIHMAECMRHNNTFDGWWRYCVKVLLYFPYRVIKYCSYRFMLTKHYRDISERSKAVIFLSYKDEGDFIRLVTPNVCKTIVIPNPIELPKNSNVGKKKQILYVGRLCKSEKNPIRLIRIWRRLFKRFTDWELVIVGEGDEGAHMKTYVRRNAIERVLFEGYKEDVSNYYATASVVCLTSNFEGWGMALSEGMSYGCIPFTFDNYGAARDIIDNGVNGFLIKPFSERQYSNRLAEIMMNDKKRIQMSENALMKSKVFAVKDVCNIWDRAFEEISKVK